MYETDVRNGYVEALLWANTMHYVDPGNGDMQLESCGGAHNEYDLDDFSAEDQYDIVQFVKLFVEENADDFAMYLTLRGAGGSDAAECFGHDLLLTRSGHGAGFWDRGLGDLGDRLTEAAKVYGDTMVEIIDGRPVLVES